MKINWHVAARMQFIKENHELYNKVNAEIFEIEFRQQKKTIWVQNIPKEAEQQHLGGMFSIFFGFGQSFLEVFRILYFQYYNGAHCNIENIQSFVYKVISYLSKGTNHIRLTVKDKENQASIRKTNYVKYFHCLVNKAVSDSAEDDRS